MFCDILVVGCGPAGSSAAKEAAKSGLKVIIVERKKSVGEPIQCAEFIPKPLLKEANISKSAIIQETKSIKLYLPDNSMFEFDSPGYMLNRSRFDKELAACAINNGAKLMLNAKFIGLNNDKAIIKRGEEIIEIVPKVIIGADGPSSTVGHCIKNINKEFLVGIQYELPLINREETLEIYFKKEFFSGYGWLFPKGIIANVGIGVKNSNIFKGDLLRELLDNFVSTLENDRKVINSPLSITVGLIPASGPLENTVFENIILVGDAAGQTHPITGGGIPQAVICGKIAGLVAAESIRLSKPEIIKDYEKKWKRIFSHQLNIAVEKRKLLESNWDDLNLIIKKCWPTFRSYYE